MKFIQWVKSSIFNTQNSVEDTHVHHASSVTIKVKVCLRRVCATCLLEHRACLSRVLVDKFENLSPRVRTSKVGLLGNREGALPTSYN